MEDPDSEWSIQQHPSFDNDDGVLKWILNKGYVIGKKMLITGIVVSSAPLVLPPLVVFSAMGVAFSVPFGLVFATYACTNKLMTKLLPTPQAPLLLDQEQQLEDIKQGFECLDDYRRIEGGLVTNMGSGIVDEKGCYTDEDDDLKREYQEDEEDEIRFDLAGDGYRKKVEASTTSVDENVVQVDQKYERIMDVEVERRVAVDDEDYRRFPQGKDTVIEVEEKELEMRIGVNVDGDERVRGLGSIGNYGGDGVDEQGYEEDVGEYLEGDDDSLEEERKEAMEDETEEIVKGSTGLLEKIRDQGRREIENDSPTKPLMVKEIDSEKKTVEKANKNDRNMGTQEKSSGQFTHAKADAREIGDVSGLNSESLEAGNERTANDNVDAPLDSNYVKVASTTNTRMPSRAASLDEGKIWENIGAMRAIVGYKAPSAATYVGELKALYAFTGVEPPASFKGDSDLDEVNANLKFLMSIVGVK